MHFTHLWFPLFIMCNQYIYYIFENAFCQLKSYQNEQQRRRQATIVIGFLEGGLHCFSFVFTFFTLACFTIVSWAETDSFLRG